ncbi:MAG: hypothetical protein JSV76_02420 [Candidatus Bathyarchaeota archaeon]|nr:MAG: hypothetical protein JSV76_02420 [Candidatus Bathyarchaeota archaeon]
MALRILSGRINPSSFAPQPRPGVFATNEGSATINFNPHTVSSTGANADRLTTIGPTGDFSVPPAYVVAPSSITLQDQLMPPDPSVPEGFRLVGWHVSVYPITKEKMVVNWGGSKGTEIGAFSYLIIGEVE